MKWKSGFRNTGKFCLWNPDYTAQGIRNPTNDWNPRIQVLLTKTGIQFLGSRIQDCPGILYSGRYNKHPNSKIVSTFKVLSPDSKRSLKKINFFASFQSDSVFRFENIVLSNFPSSLRVTLIWRPKRPSHMLKNNFIA